MRDQPRELGLPGHGARGLRELTAARVALGRSGSSLRTQAHLEFQLDHAAARDAVQSRMDTRSLVEDLRKREWPVVVLETSAAATAGSTGRKTYLQRPDLGRRLCSASAATLRAAAGDLVEKPEVIFLLADGLSALAIERNAVPLLDAVQPLLRVHGWRSGPLCVVEDGRVAVGDEVGELLGASLSVMLIGERPGLSASDSLGVYLTWAPRVGRSDAERNCISNIRLGGLSHPEAAQRLIALMNRARASRRSGVDLQAGNGTPPSLP